MSNSIDPGGQPVGKWVVLYPLLAVSLSPSGRIGTSRHRHQFSTLPHTAQAPHNRKMVCSAAIKGCGPVGG